MENLGILELLQTLSSLGGGQSNAPQEQNQEESTPSATSSETEKPTENIKSVPEKSKNQKSEDAYFTFLAQHDTRAHKIDKKDS